MLRRRSAPESEPTGHIRGTRPALCRLRPARGGDGSPARSERAGMDWRVWSAVEGGPKMYIGGGVLVLILIIILLILIF